jgi:hypothetical protein
MMMATTSLCSTSLVETCLLVSSYFSKRPQRLSNVVETCLGREVSHCEHESVGKGEAGCRVRGRAADEAGPAVRALQTTYGRGAITLAARQGLT